MQEDVPAAEEVVKGEIVCKDGDEPLATVHRGLHPLLQQVLRQHGRLLRQKQLHVRHVLLQQRQPHRVQPLHGRVHSALQQGRQRPEGVFFAHVQKQQASNIAHPLHIPHLPPQASSVDPKCTT
eukprot:CAMPEP_0177772624 /NCGR_PEP_ID=MMETSP0491_2-20121128/12349_1 /TAXON_ID=63592 /ORGANISM="Tetraselmis chuii, Strain PLY429" /LENGTH=123 /DNA_ID=CAMNT_0019290501 /DNA_START=247 /DNA_END=618 /DNA_ORIENTATION=+